MRNKKWKSTKFWFTLWATGLLTFIVLANRMEFAQLGMVLAAAPMAYCYCNVKQKELFSNRIGEDK